MGRGITYMHLANVEMLEKLHAQFLHDPMSVDPSWRHFFEGVEFAEFQKLKKEVPAEHEGDIRIYNLIDAYRRYGHLQAHVNPIAVQPPAPANELKLSTLYFSDSELDHLFPTYGFLGMPQAPLSKMIGVLQEIYCGSIGIEYMGMHSPEMERWLQSQIEPSHFRPSFSIENKKRILANLNKAELFEIFLHTKYVGQKRFSLEGAETLIPILAEIVELGSEAGMDEFVIGMAHRGRLNVLANILNKSYSMVFSEFEDYVDPNLIESAGDVKYHKGYSSNVVTGRGLPVHISLTANPSHLESVNAVVQGKVRAKQQQRRDIHRRKVVPILIHGDAAFAGQGVVYETLQLSKLAGYTTGGTLHIILNNHIGFTTLPKEYCSTHHCTDIARAFGIPVFHVNAEDPERCVLATKMALRLRHLFRCDVIIDLNCYRKLGHNEGDEPAFTQPLEYQLIRKKKSVREIYRDFLITQGVLEREMALSLEEEFKKSLHFELEEWKLAKEPSLPEAFGGVWKNYRQGDKSVIFQPVQTAVDRNTLKEISDTFCTIPSGFEAHKKLLKLIEDRKRMGDGKQPLDWAMCEHLAFGSILWEGIPVRLAGQDSQRGTFTQRHAVWVDQKTGKSYVPLAHLKEKQGHFEVYNSSLSEYAAMGFEWGYSLSYPSALVMWEAQFGDFANGGQVIFDQYLTASAQKWKRYSGFVALLPHGYEGQGAEHSSARIERFLQLAAESNFQVVYPSTPAQYFHVLRRQVKRLFRLPLILFTPKGMLRHPDCVSSLDDLSQGRFQEIIDDVHGNASAKRLIFCSGRIFYDLSQERAKRQAHHVAIIRIEQLYPLHHDAFVQILGKYKAVKEYFWVQEEPRNMGAFSYIHPLLKELLPNKPKVHYVGRNRSASTAAGSHTVHQKEHEQLMNMAFEDERRD